ncbi:hypothetical protein bcgnr5371_60150 [Bacillus cereus]|uniref:hypothetical protein n=1 Tax=Bacillus sp. BML-BC051 TaxID=2842486 RepID=UPI001C7F501D|nr:hypothetical protein [Bacillus sp. BML-BC051]BCD33084.1 hypothetical protein BC30102_p115 [Bacillus cereus]HDR6313187.1 hypothetical protein [Bacillus cereus]
MGRKKGRPQTTKPYRKRTIRFSFLEDAFRRVLERVDDPRARIEIQRELAELIGKQKAMETEKEIKKKREMVV